MLLCNRLSYVWIKLLQIDVESLFFNFFELGILLLAFSLFIYLYGICCIILNRENILILMIFIEVMFVGIFFIFLSTSHVLSLEIGQSYALMVLIGAACESAVGLGILLILFRFDVNTQLSQLTQLKG